jgi:ACR3 family arsenite transporter
MLYPALAKVHYESLGRFRTAWKLFATSLVFNWILGPLLMFALAWLMLPDEPHYRNGVILIGLARCIGMVLIWNMLAGGDGDAAAVLVALNSLFQMISYAMLGWLFLTAIPAWFGASSTTLTITYEEIIKSTLIFLGIPLVAGAATRLILLPRKGANWYDQEFMARLGPTALAGLLYTIVLMFSMQGNRILKLPFDVLRIAAPLISYFVIMFTVAFFLAKQMGFPYEATAALAFTAAGNNFELAIAVSVATFGIASGEALAGVVGPLIEVPVLVTLVYFSLWLRHRLFPETPPDDPATSQMREPVAQPARPEIFANTPIEREFR